MLGWIALPLHQRRLLPEHRGRPTPWVIAIMTFVTLVVAAAGLALANAARVVEAGAAARYSIQIPDGGRTVAAAATAAQATPGVSKVAIVPEAEVRATLDRWLGLDIASGAALPLPGLVDLQLAPGVDLRALEARVRAASPGARVLSYREQLGPVLGTLRALQWLATSLVALMILATAASVVLATRAAFDGNRGTVDVMHGIGATDEQLAVLFQRRIAIDALGGGLAGAVAAGAVLLLVANAPGGLLGDLTGAPALRPVDLVLLALVPLGAGILATLVARYTLLRALRASL
jgi:cell division transport system permease protein